MADVLTATNGRVARALRAWIARATSSLPTPVSPVTSTGALDRATKSMVVCSARMAGPCPTSVMSVDAVDGGRRRRVLSLGCRRASSALGDDA